MCLWHACVAALWMIHWERWPQAPSFAPWLQLVWYVPCHLLLAALCVWVWVHDVGVHAMFAALCTVCQLRGVWRVPQC